MFLTSSYLFAPNLRNIPSQANVSFWGVCCPIGMIPDNCCYNPFLFPAAKPAGQWIIIGFLLPIKYHVIVLP